MTALGAGFASEYGITLYLTPNPKPHCLVIKPTSTMVLQSMQAFRHKRYEQQQQQEAQQRESADSKFWETHHILGGVSMGAVEPGADLDASEQSESVFQEADTLRQRSGSHLGPQKQC